MHMWTIFFLFFFKNSYVWQCIFVMIKKMQGSNKVTAFRFEKSVSRSVSFLEVIESVEIS